MPNSSKQLSQYFFETWLAVSIWKYVIVDGFSSEEFLKYIFHVLKRKMAKTYLQIQP